ncbi:hypothetical protein F5Y08DRAFT_353465 [Xylaria arbuscula]|nr:hypothetical protein F5Y08DRAFT_353465 [Xylaria arbuscula]
MSAACERERIISLISMINDVQSAFTRAKGNLAHIRDDEAREELDAALDRADEAICNFSNVFEFYCDEQIGEIVDSYPSSTESSSHDDANDDDEGIFPFSATESQGLGVPRRTIDESPRPTSEDGPETFDRQNPPSLSTIAEWLGLGDIITAASVLNAKPIQLTFSKYRATNGKVSCARVPEKLKQTMAFFIFPRERLLNWQGSSVGRRFDGINFSAALFAYHVVRYLAGSCEEVDWKSVNHEDGIEAYEIAKRRFAIALQIFWFLEKTFDLDL